MKRAFLPALGLATAFIVIAWLGRVTYGWGAPTVFFGVFGVVAASAYFFTTLNEERKKQRYTEEGVRKDFLPTFCYLDGLAAGKSASVVHSLALISPEALIVCRCDPAAYGMPLDTAWEHIKGELGRVGLREIESVQVHLFDRDQLAQDRMESFFVDGAVNLTIGKLLGASIGTIHLDAAIILNRRGLPPVSFGVSRSAGGSSVLSLAGLLLDAVDVALPKGLPDFVEYGSGALGLLKGLEQDPDPVQNAKKLAHVIDALAAQQRRADATRPINPAPLD